MNGVLVDTSVWVSHFRRRDDVLVNLLTLNLALTHPMVVTELACGTPPAPRARTLADIGLVDLTLLASTLLTAGSRPWTQDLRLTRLAARFKIAYLPVRY